MPTCPRCRVAFLDGESHTCAPRNRRALVAWSCIAVAYGVSSYMAGSPFAPGAIAIYLFMVLLLGAGHLIASFFRMFGG